MAADDFVVNGPFREAFSLQLQEVERSVFQELGRLERALGLGPTTAEKAADASWFPGAPPSELPAEPCTSAAPPSFAAAKDAANDETPPEAVPPERQAADQDSFPRLRVCEAPHLRLIGTDGLLKNIDEISRCCAMVSSRMNSAEELPPAQAPAQGSSRGSSRAVRASAESTGSSRVVRVSAESMDMDTYVYESEGATGVPDRAPDRVTRKGLRGRTAEERITELELYGEWVTDTFVHTQTIGTSEDDRGSQHTQVQVQAVASTGRKGRRIRGTSADLEFFSARQGAALQVAEQPRCILNPSSHTRMCWDILGILFLAFDAFWIPLNLSTLVNANQVIDLSTLMYWSCDIWMTFGTGYYVRGKLIMNPKRIAVYYLRTWFGLDMVLVGVGWLSQIQHIASGGDDDENGRGSGQSVALFLVKGLKSARILRLLRLMKLRQLLYVIYEQINSEWVSLMLGAAQNVVALLAVNHIIGCIWYLIGSQGRGDQRKSWVTVHLEGGDLDDPVGRYLMSLHWSLTQFTPASMQVHPENTGERAFTVAVLLLAMITFSSFVSSITTAMTRLRNLKTAELTQTLLLRRYLKDNHISRDLCARVIRYVNIVLRKKGKTDRSKVMFLTLLSGPLQVELQKELVQPHLTNYTFFESYELLSPPAMSQLCFVAVAALNLSKRDVLFHYGVESTRMYFLTEGALFYRRKCAAKKAGTSAGQDPSPRMVFLKAGSYFCEMPLWVKWSHRGHMRALTESTLFVLDAPKFREVTTSHQAVLHRSRAYAKECMNTWTQDARDHEKQLWDVGAGVQLRPHLKKGQSMPDSEHIDEAVLMSVSTSGEESETESEDDAEEVDGSCRIESAIRSVRRSLEFRASKVLRNSERDACSRRFSQSQMEPPSRKS